MENCIEYLVRLPAVLAIGLEYGLHLVELMTLQEWIERSSRHKDMMDIRYTTGVIGPKGPQRSVTGIEWDAIGIYCVAIWQKL